MKRLLKIFGFLVLFFTRQSFAAGGDGWSDLSGERFGASEWLTFNNYNPREVTRICERVLLHCKNTDVDGVKTILRTWEVNPIIIRQIYYAYTDNSALFPAIEEGDESSKMFQIKKCMEEAFAKAVEKMKDKEYTRLSAYFMDPEYAFGL
jgi:hypothetical protein